MYAIEYITELNGLCKTVNDNLKECGVDVTCKDISEYRSNNKIYKAPFTEFYTDNGVFIDHKIGFISVADIKHMINVYDCKRTG